VRPIFAFNSRNELFVWGIRMTQGRTQRKERGLRWAIKYFCYEVLTPLGQASHGTISEMKQATLGHLNEIASAFNSHTESETRRLRFEQRLHRQSLAEFERVQAERRLTLRHELAYEALSPTIPSPIINIIAGLLGHTAPTGSELQEEIHEATVERVRHTLATSGLPHALILITILYTHTHPMTSPFFFLVRRVDSLHTLEWRLIGHPSHCTDSPDISITRQRP
jgi:hypothetical protein